MNDQVKGVEDYQRRALVQSLAEQEAAKGARKAFVQDASMRILAGYASNDSADEVKVVRAVRLAEVLADKLAERRYL